MIAIRIFLLPEWIFIFMLATKFPYLYALNIDDCNQLGKGWHNEPESFYIHLKKCFGNDDGMLTLNGINFFSFKV